MSQPSQAQYGRQSQPQYGYDGGYPQQGPPPQQGPGRFYTPGPNGVPPGKIQFLKGHASILTTADSRTPKPQYPPQNGPQPFSYAAQAQAPQVHQPQYPSHDSRNRIPSANQGPPSSDPYSHRPQSTYDNPQELSSASYASPTDTRPQVYPPHTQPSKPESEYSPSLHSPTDGEPYGQAPQSQPPYASQQAPYPHTPVGPPSTQDHYAPYEIAPPSQPPPQAPSPSMGQNPYPTLNSGPPGGYQAYHAPPPQQQPGFVAEAQGNPNDFYR